MTTRSGAETEQGLRALRASLIGIYMERFGAVPGRLEETLGQVANLARLQTLISLFLRGSSDEILHTVAASAVHR